MTSMTGRSAVAVAWLLAVAIGACVGGALLLLRLDMTRRPADQALVPDAVSSIRQPTAESRPAGDLLRASPSVQSGRSPVKGVADATATTTEDVVRQEQRRLDEMSRRMHDRAREEEWEKQHSVLSSDMMLAQRDELEDAILETTREYFEGEFAANRFELIHEADPALLVTRRNPLLISWLRYEPGSSNVKRVVLPESPFEAQYRIRELSTWLSIKAHELKNAGAAK